MSDTPKPNLKRKLREKINLENKNELVSMMRNYKKVDYRMYENRQFKMSDYFNTLNIANSRMKLRYELSMIQTVRDNQHNNKKYREENFQCIDCANIGILNITDTQKHLLSSACIANSDLREGRNFDRDVDICEFFRSLIERRKELYGC